MFECALIGLIEEGQVGLIGGHAFDEDGEFEWVICIQTLEHAYNVEKALAEIKRVTSTGVLLSVPLESKISYEGNPSHYTYSRSPFSWLGLMHEVEGFYPIQVSVDLGYRYMDIIALRITDGFKVL